MEMPKDLIECEVDNTPTKNKYFLCSDVELRKKIRYAKNPLEKRMYQKMLSDKKYRPFA